MRNLMLAVPVTFCLLALPGCSSTIAGSSSPTPAPPTAAVSAGMPVAHVAFTDDPRDVAKNRTFDFSGDAESICYPVTSNIGSGIEVRISDDKAADGQMSGISLQAGKPGTGPGQAYIQTDFNVQAAGTDYDSSYRTSDGKVGKATAESVLGTDGVLTVTFDATSWDGAAYHGTLACTPTSA